MCQVRKHQYSQILQKVFETKLKLFKVSISRKQTLATNQPKVVFLKILLISITKTHQYQFWWWVSERCRIAVETADIRTFLAAVFCQKKESWRIYAVPSPPLTTYSDKSPTLPVSWEPLWLGECLVCGKERELMTNGDNYTNLSDPPVLRGCSTEGNMT